MVIYSVEAQNHLEWIKSLDLLLINMYSMYIMCVGGHA